MYTLGTNMHPLVFERYSRSDSFDTTSTSSVTVVPKW